MIASAFSSLTKYLLFDLLDLVSGLCSLGSSVLGFVGYRWKRTGLYGP